MRGNMCGNQQKRRKCCIMVQHQSNTERSEMTPRALEYFKSLKPIEKKALCQKVGISVRWLHNCMYVPSKNFSPEVAEKIEMVSCRKVTREDLRPDIDWSLIR